MYLFLERFIRIAKIKHFKNFPYFFFVLVLLTEKLSTIFSTYLQKFNGPYIIVLSVSDRFFSREISIANGTHISISLSIVKTLSFSNKKLFLFLSKDSREWNVV